jgi:hypothetical protein
MPPAVAKMCRRQRVLAQTCAHLCPAASAPPRPAAASAAPRPAAASAAGAAAGEDDADEEHVDWGAFYEHADAAGLGPVELRAEGQLLEPTGAGSDGPAVATAAAGGRAAPPFCARPNSGMLGDSPYLSLNLSCDVPQRCLLLGVLAAAFAFMFKLARRDFHQMGSG